MIKTVYAVGMMRVANNDSQFAKAQHPDISEEEVIAVASGEVSAHELALKKSPRPVQAIFDDPIEAAQHAIDNEWWPFCIERIEYHTKGES